MGVVINLAISHSVTKDEWKSVYEESLKLVDAFPLAEWHEEVIKGVAVICLVRTKEREIKRWGSFKTSMGWNTIGDYENMKTAEDYFLPRDLVEDDDCKTIECDDALFGVLPNYLDEYDWNDRVNPYRCWGNKTQGRSYHMYLLAVACMIESRLGKKTYVYGDITRGQCLKAVDLANEVLVDPIHVPDRCDMDRLCARIDALPITDVEKLVLFENTYLGKKDADFGTFIRNHFSNGICEDYWKKRLGNYAVNTIGFSKAFYDYMLWGFELGEICRWINFSDERGNKYYDYFVKNVLNAKLHIREKDCYDPLKIDPDSSNPYGISALMAQFAFVGAENKKIDRYIPIDEIREKLNKSIGDKCNVNGIIDKYLKKEAELAKKGLSENPTEDEINEACEQDASLVFKQLMDRKYDWYYKAKEEYDIAEEADLPFYEEGDTVRPGILEALGKSFVFYRSLLCEEQYQYLMKDTPEKRCEFLAKQNSQLYLRDKDWEKIFTDIIEREETFERYYPMVRVEVNDEGLIGMLTGMVLNDDLYRLCFELAEKYG